jgi:hypothetical protein
MNGCLWLRVELLDGSVPGYGCVLDRYPRIESNHRVFAFTPFAVSHLRHLVVGQWGKSELKGNTPRV